MNREKLRRRWGRFWRVRLLLFRLDAWYFRWGRDLITLAAIALAAWAVYLAEGTVSKQRKESAERRNQNCLIFERDQERAVRTLAGTYRYLAGLSAKQLHEPLNQAVLANLPRTLSDAQNADAPAYCDAPGVGLPEPNPTIPAAPKWLPK